MPDSASTVVDDPLVGILKTRLIPTWERFGGGRLVVVAPTREQFHTQSLPELIHTSVKKRIGKRTTAARTRLYNNASAFMETWPEDDQALALHPALAFVLEGQADFHVADYLVHCPRDHFVLFTADVPRGMGGRSHLEGKEKEQRKCVVLWIFAPPGTNSITAYTCHSEGNEHWTDEYCIVHQREAIHSFELFVREFEEQSPGYERIAVMSCMILMQLFLREIQRGHFHRVGKSSTVNAPETTITQIEQARQYVKTHLNQPLTAARIAREIYMSRSSFIQHFVRETGMTFHEFVTRERMEESKRLLSDGYWSINLVSKFVGLKPSQFRVQFKNHFGVSPAAFREQMRSRAEK